MSEVTEKDILEFILSQPNGREIDMKEASSDVGRCIGCILVHYGHENLPYEGFSCGTNTITLIGGSKSVYMDRSIGGILEDIGLSNPYSWRGTYGDLKEGARRRLNEMGPQSVEQWVKESPKMLTKKGWYSAYALACGYVEEMDIGVEHNSNFIPIAGVRIQMIHDGGIGYSGGISYDVKVFDFGEGRRLLWETFETVTEARKEFSRAVKEQRKRYES